ncbi:MULTISPECIES: tyrosine-type recombinase/integrase [unclassified Streptomyces]|uniref:tyrosine-type recombinase/integrase n=1 Tax=unclassified Streptomyces TaxID=2593676 RepID=UPI0033D600CE
MRAGTALRVLPLHRAPGGGEEEATRLSGMISDAFLCEAGWDAEQQVLRLPAEHPLLGRPVCRVDDCTKHGVGLRQLCDSCGNRFEVSRLPFDEFRVLPRPARNTRQVMCAVADCGLPRMTAPAQMCRIHHYRRTKLQLSLEDFLAHPGTVALAGFGPCLVVACLRVREGAGPYCTPHQNRWARLSKRGSGVSEELWRRTSPGIAQEGEVSLRGLSSFAVVQVLLGLQMRTRDGTKTNDDALRILCDRLRERRAAALRDLPEHGLSKTQLNLLRMLRRYVEQALLDPESERRKSCWDTRAFGHSGLLDFSRITQQWLRQGCMRWAADNLPKRRGKNVTSRVRMQLDGMVLLSDSLRAQRVDNGEVPAVLGRRDIENFLARLALLDSCGELSAYMRHRACSAVRLVLGRMRSLGLTRPGEPAEALPDDFHLGRADMPAEPDRKDEERDLPQEVMRQLCARLPAIEADGADRQTRVAIELMIDTGRRPDEICALPFDCLSSDRDGKPLLIYNNYKEHRFARRLPIAQATADLIADQQRLTHSRFPDTSPSRLMLLPSRVRNADGSRPIGENGVAARHRTWVDAMPPFTVLVGDTTVEFDKARIVLYAYRHCYAQRHADAGVPADVLRELLDHEGYDCLQRYYRVSEQRRRQAVEKVTSMQFDRHGRRMWREAVHILAADRARHSVEEVAVPFGRCTEPSNVQAGGGSCPIRYRCAGCDHFTTDVSYLPDLKAYLDDLLRSRERIRSMAAADAWAKTEATPSDEEIRRIRRLISRVTQDLDSLSPEEREQIERACATVRKSRQTLLGMPRVRPPLPDLRPERSDAP